MSAPELKPCPSEVVTPWNVRASYLITAAQAEIAQLRAERDAAMAGRVKVKPLVWEASVINKPWSSAKAPWGWYYAQWDDETQAWFASLEMGEVEAPIILSPSDVPSIDAAKAAAQTDYEARILAAIQPDTERAEPVADRFSGDRAELIVQAVWQSCAHGGGWWVVLDADGRETLLSAETPIYTTPQPAPPTQAREITVQEAARVLLDADGRANASLVQIAEDIYAAGGSMPRAIGEALRALAAMQKEPTHDQP